MTALVDAIAATSAWEWAAMVLGVAYVVLAARENAWCWVAGFASTAIYVGLFWDASLVMESALQVFYLGVSVFGLWKWRRGSSEDDAPIRTFTAGQHVAAIVLVGVLTLVSGWALSGTSAALPYLDSFTTWAGVITTVLVAYKVLENWLYWLVINCVGMYLYATRGLMLTVVLYGIYQVVAVAGYLRWRRVLQEQS